MKNTSILPPCKPWSLFLLSLSGFCFGQSGQAQPTAAAPNILVFLADDAGMDFGCYGNDRVSTPHIDRLAAEGMRFEKAFLTSPQSSPSRTSMMTGMFAHTIGTEDLHSPLQAGCRMIPAYLKQAGYRTGSLLKTHWGPEGDKQFDRMIPGGYLPGQGDLTEETFRNYTRFLDECGQNPFFLWIGFIDPHRPYNREVCPQVNDPDRMIVPPFLADGAATRRDLADYNDEISRMDRNIGRMLAILEEKGKLDNTLVIFLSDNGMPFPRCKGSLYDSGIRTPLVARWKGHIRPGAVHTNGLVSTIDLAPTLLSVAGVQPPAEMYGHSFLHLLLDPSRHGRDYIFSERNWHDTDEYIRCIRSEKYKLIYNAYYELPHGTAADLSSSLSWYELKERQRHGALTNEQMQIFTAPRAMVELYDVENDPYELDNIADRQEAVGRTKQLARLLIEWQKKTGDHPWWKRRRADTNDRITGYPLFKKVPEVIDN